MKGLRAISKTTVDVDRLFKAGEKALADANKVAVIPINFIFISICLLQLNLQGKARLSDDCPNMVYGEPKAEGLVVVDSYPIFCIHFRRFV